jgi:ubiquinone/menaquinone biosynthesis C-methylase UbiE
VGDADTVAHAPTRLAGLFGDMTTMLEGADMEMRIDTESRGNAKTLTDEEILAVYRQILSPDAVKRYDKANGWFQRYNGALAQPERGRRYLRAIRNSLKLTDAALAGKEVLEVGCGFGLTCMTLALRGAKSVHCLDTFASMIETIEAYLPDVPHRDRIHPRVGRADALPYEDNRFDVILTVEALSHFLNPDKCVAEAYRVLKPGGVYIIADDNNGQNARAVRVNQEVWDRFENGPPTDDIHGHRVLEPYVARRKRIIREVFPALRDDEAEQLAQRTAFMVKREILEACSRYVSDRTLPSSVYRSGMCPVEPETGQYIENLIDPLALKKRMEAMGFRVEVEAYFGGESRGGALYAANNVLNAVVPEPLIFRVSPGFRIRAYKPADAAT